MKNREEWFYRYGVFPRNAAVAKKRFDYLRMIEMTWARLDSKRMCIRLESKQCPTK